jgi:hypothetical protein
MGAWTEIVDFTFTANETSRAFTGLNITKDDFIKVTISLTEATNTTQGYFIFPNTAAGVSGFDTISNYHRQFIRGEGSTVSAIRTNDAAIGVTQGNTTNYFTVYCKISENGKWNSFSNNFLRLDSSLRTAFEYTTSSNLTFNDPITSLKLQANETNGIGTGSRIQIYRLDAEKVADFTLTSNSAQVSIPFPSGTFDPAINKDSEYLLVSDVIATGGDTNIQLTPNDSTTSTGYHRQRIAADGSTASASRANNPIYLSPLNNTNAVGYAHIKLSEIGAFTAQSYTLVRAGATNPLIFNDFISSTAENITSITKLNLIEPLGSRIASGSRFILYKLK